MTKGTITSAFLSARVSNSNVAFSAHALVSEPSVSRVTWSSGLACGAQALVNFTQVYAASSSTDGKADSTLASPEQL